MFPDVYGKRQETVREPFTKKAVREAFFGHLHLCWSFRKGLAMQRFSVGISAILLATAASAQDIGTAKTNFVDAEGEIVGTAEISDAPSGGVLFRIDISGLPSKPGSHFMFTRQARATMKRTMNQRAVTLMLIQKIMGIGLQTAHMRETCRTSS